MPSLHVQSVEARPSFETKMGGTLYPFRLTGLLDGQLDTVEMNFKAPSNCPKAGDVLEVTVEDGPYGKKAKKVQSPFQGGPGAAPRERDPEVQRMIVRQNALSNAVNFLAEKAKLDKKSDELTTDNVLLVATKFAAFSIGDLKAKAPEPVPEREAAEYEQDYPA